MNRHERRKLEKVWSQIPNANCKGLCVDTCTVIGMQYVEYVQLTKFSKQKPFFKDGHCGYLVDGKCSVYPVRPTVCRLSGTTHGLPCPFGCVPDRVVPQTEARSIMREVIRMSGNTDMYFNATDDQITEYVCQITAQSVKGTLQLSHPIQSIALILRRLILTLNRIWSKVHSFLFHRTERPY